MLKLNNNTKIDEIRQEIKEVYLAHTSTPFIIGYSGGKDSTTVLQLFIEVLFELKNNGVTGSDVYVISADTLVENPLVIAKTRRSMENLKNYCAKFELPIHVEMVYPEFDDTFFANMIGRGYPAPLQSFRWCTDRVKIKPANKFIVDKINDNGEVIMVLGTRYEESTSRKTSMEKHEVAGSKLSLHSTFSSAWTYAPIASLEVDELWTYLLNSTSPWGDSNDELYKLYSDSSGECPLIVDEEMKKQASCGNSRFGCWTCTVVAKDKSLTGFINSGETYLQVLLDYRDNILKIRDNNAKRNLFDNRGNLKLVTAMVKDGNIIIPKKLYREETIINIASKKDLSGRVCLFDETEVLNAISDGTIDPLSSVVCIYKNGKYFRIGASGFNEETRYEMLSDLLDTELKLNLHIDFILITREEIIAIDKLWKSYGYDISAIELYNLKYPNNLIINTTNNINYQLLKALAKENSFDTSTLLQIINNTNTNKTLNNRNSNIKYIDDKLNTYKLLLTKEKNENN